MKAIVVGCGAIASRWVRVLNADPRVSIVALADPDPQQAARLADRYDLRGPISATLDQSLDEHPCAEVVVNLTPPGRHAEISHTALSCGRHVLTEKPLATNLADAQHLVRLAERAGRRLAVMQNRRHDPEFVRFCDKLHAELGDQAGPLAVAADVCVPLHQPGFRVDQPLPVTTDLAVHGLDQIQALVPAAATLVSCVETPLPFLGGHCALAAITVRFTDGSVFAYRGGYTGAGLATPATGTWRVDGADVSARWTDPGHGHDGATAQTPGYQRCITAMLDTLHGREPAAPATLTTVLRSTAMLEAALTSARAGASPVPVAPIEVQS